MNLISDADALVEGDEVCATAEESVLAVVEDFVDAGVQVGTSASAEIASSFDEMDQKFAVCKTAGGREAGDAAADDGNGFLSVSDWCCGGDAFPQGLKPTLLLP